MPQLIPSILPLLVLTATSAAAPPAPAPPTVRMLVVRSADAPLLNEVEDDEPAAEVAHRGDLLELIRPLPPMAWKAHVGRVIGERDGAMAEVRRAPGDAILFGFASDLGEEAEVPAGAWVCDAIAADRSLPAAAKQGRCADLLRMTRLDSGAVAAFVPCASGPCPVALVKDGVVEATAVDGIVAGSVVPGGTDGVLLLETRWVRENGAWSGSALVPVALSGGRLKRLKEIPVDEVDSRDAVTVTSRDAVYDVTPADGRTRVAVTGKRRTVQRADARELAATSISESHVLP